MLLSSPLYRRGKQGREVKQLTERRWVHKWPKWVLTSGGGIPVLVLLIVSSSDVPEEASGQSGAMPMGQSAAAAKGQKCRPLPSSAACITPRVVPVTGFQSRNLTDHCTGGIGALACDFSCMLSPRISPSFYEASADLLIRIISPSGPLNRK